MSKRIEEMLAKSAKMRSTKDVSPEEIPKDPDPRIGAVRTAKLEIIKYEKELPLKDLREVAGRRRNLTPEQFVELKTNLSNNPLTSPIAVRRIEGGYEIVAGHNRVQAYRELGRERILSVVLELTDDEAERSAFYSNLLSPALPDFEKYLGLRARIDHGQMTQDQVAREAGMLQQSVSLLMSFSGLPKAAITVLENAPNKGLLGASAAAKLAQIAKSGKQGRVVEAVQQLAEGKFSQARAVSHAAGADGSGGGRNAAPPMIIRSGKKAYCTVRTVGNEIRMSFTSAINDDLLRELAAAIERHARQGN